MSGVVFRKRCQAVIRGTSRNATSVKDGPPTDLDDVLVLPRAVLCARHADCVIDYEGNDKGAGGPSALRRV